MKFINQNDNRTSPVIMLQQIIAFVLALSLFTAIPYSKSFAFNWAIEIPGSYKISFFNFVEMVCYGILFFTFKTGVANKYEKNLLITASLVLLARIVSLVFALKFETAQLMSLVRYIEVLVSLLMLVNLLGYKSNRVYFIAGIITGVALECVFGFVIFIQTGGFLRGIFMGIPSYQLIILCVVFVLLLSRKYNNYILIIPVVMLLLGIIATQTRAAFIQLFVALVLVIVYSIQQKFVKKVIPVIIISGIIFTFTIEQLDVFLKTAKDRIEEAVKEGAAEMENDDGSPKGVGTVQYRLFLWDKAIGAFLSHPVTGIGSGGFPRQLTELPQPFGVTLERIDKGTPLSTHNTFLGVLAETGVIGILAYFIWFIALVKIVLAVYRSKTDDMFLISCCMILAVFLFSDFWSQQSFLPNLTFVTAYCLGSLRSDPDSDKKEWVAE